MDTAVFFLILFPLSVFSQTIQESGPGVVKPSQQLKSTCTVSGFEITSYHMHWLRQLSGKGLEWIGIINTSGGTALTDSLKSRVTITRDVGKKQVYLQMEQMVIEDTGIYYCVRHGLGTGHYFDVWGPGTTVTVTSATQSAPSLFPLLSCGTSLDSTITIGCLAKDFLPDSLSFSWTDKSNGSYTNGFKKYNSVMQSSGTYSASTQIKVASESWDKSDPFYCVAKSAVNTKTLRLEKREVSEPRRPKVSIHPPLKNDWENNGNGIIVCIASEFYPKLIKISWLMNSEKTTLHTETENVVPDGSGNFTVKSYITVPTKDWNRDAVFSCVVEHPGSGTVEIRNISKSQVCDSMGSSGQIQIFAIAPSFETIYLKKVAILTCLVTNLGNKEGLNIIWREVGSDKELDTKPEDPVFSNDNFTYSAKAVATVCVDDWYKNKYECTVTHPELATPGKVFLSKQNGVEPMAPSIYVFPPHQDELSRREYVTLTCLVKGFSPKDVMVMWQNADGKEITNVSNTDPIEETDPSGKTSYYMYSKLTLLRDDWNKEVTYTCVAGHESLPLQFIQRSIDKISGKPTSVNVSLIMSDSC